MKTAAKILRIAAIVVICLLCIMPFYILLVLALNSPQRIFYEGNIFVPDFYWQNFVDAWETAKMGDYMLNSVFVTALSLLILLVVALPASYCLSRV